MKNVIKILNTRVNKKDAVENIYFLDIFFLFRSKGCDDSSHLIRHLQHCFFLVHYTKAGTAIFLCGLRIIAKHIRGFI